MKLFEKWLKARIADEDHDEHVTEFRHAIFHKAGEMAREQVERYALKARRQSDEADYIVRLAREERDALTAALGDTILSSAKQIAALKVKVETLKLKLENLGVDDE